MTRLTTKCVALLLLAAMAFPMLLGCGVGSTVQENNRVIGRIWDYDARMMTDDLGLLVLAKRPFRNSRFPIK